jgi:hypothetical protein
VQLGIGVENGAEIGGRMAQLVFDFVPNGRFGQGRLDALDHV